METIKEYFPRLKRFLFILVVVLVVLTLISYPINNGFLDVPSGATFVKNYDNLESVKTWSQFKQDYTDFDPEKAWNIIPINVNFNSWWAEFAYPKSVTAVYIEVDMTSLTDSLQKPSFLVILLDQNERIRGKLYTRYESRDYSLKGKTAEYAFWFEFPDDMRGKKYSVIVELFGIYDFEHSVRYSTAIYTDEVNWIYDDIYGQLPSTYEELSLLSYYRFDTKTAPPSSIIDVWTLAFSAALLISGTIEVFLIKFVKEIKNYHQQHPHLLLYESFCFLSLILFIVFVFLISLRF